jgi:hypothetical protein
MKEAVLPFRVINGRFSSSPLFTGISAPERAAFPSFFLLFFSPQRKTIGSTADLALHVSILNPLSTGRSRKNVK